LTSDLSGSKAETNLEPAPEPHAGDTRKRKRFSSETTNDLLFWGAHLLVVAISLGIMWVKVDGLAKAMKTLLLAQNRQVAIVQEQAKQDQVASVQAQQAEHTRSIQFEASTRVLSGVLSQVGDIQADIKRTLAKAEETNKLVLAQSEATRTAALESQQAANQAAGAAQSAAGAAGGAASAARAAAAVSSRTGNVVASKVVTSSDKARVQAEQRALAAKKAQLTRTIKQVKKNGPNLIQQIFH
jgi:hypothetical protein